MLKARFSFFRNSSAEGSEWMTTFVKGVASRRSNSGSVGAAVEMRGNRC